MSKQQLADEQTRMAIQKQKEKSIVCYNRHNSRKHPHLHAGQKVYIQQEKTCLWELGMICRSATSPSSYIVESESGSIHRRNRQFIRSAKRDSMLEDSHDQELITNANTPLSMFPHLIIHFRVGHRQTPARERYLRNEHLP